MYKSVRFVLPPAVREVNEAPIKLFGKQENSNVWNVAWGVNKSLQPIWKNKNSNELKIYEEQFLQITIMDSSSTVYIDHL